SNASTRYAVHSKQPRTLTWVARIHRGADGHRELRQVIPCRVYRLRRARASDRPRRPFKMRSSCKRHRLLSLLPFFEKRDQFGHDELVFGPADSRLDFDQSRQVDDANLDSFVAHHFGVWQELLIALTRF